MSSRRGPRGQPEHGQGLVELTLIFPILMLMLGGMIQFGMIFWDRTL